MKEIKNIILSIGNYISNEYFNFFDFKNELKCNYQIAENTIFPNSRRSNIFYIISEEYKKIIFELCKKYNYFENVKATDEDNLPDGR